jgi:hypothetical protein
MLWPMGVAKNSGPVVGGGPWPRSDHLSLSDVIGTQGEILPPH